MSDWEQCSDPECNGARVIGFEKCIAHVDSAALDDELTRFRGQGTLDLRGVSITSELMDRILDTAPRGDDSNPTFDDVSFQEAQFETEARFKGVVFRHPAAFQETIFNRDAIFTQAMFEEDADFSGAIFRAQVSFKSATFRKRARFTRPLSRSSDLEVPNSTEGEGESGDIDAETGLPIIRVRAEGPVRTAIFMGDVSFDYATFGSLDVHRVTFERAVTLLGVRIWRSADFRRAVCKQKATFVGTSFEGPANFTAATFEGKSDPREMFDRGTSFHGVIFEDEAYFGGAIFRSDAEFSRAEFRGDVAYTDAVFELPPSFYMTKFMAEAVFHMTVFTGGPDFAHASFQKEAVFTQVLFEGHPRFAGSEFHGHATFKWSRFDTDVNFQSARFHMGADLQLSTWRAKADFTDSFIEGDYLNLDGCFFANFLELDVGVGRLSATRSRFVAGGHLRVYAPTEILLEDADFPVPFIISGTSESEAAPRIISLRRANVAGLVLIAVNLETCLFGNSHNLDRLRIEGGSVFAHVPRGWKLSRVGGEGVPVWRWTRRQVLAEEHHWRASRPVLPARKGISRSKRIGWSPPAVVTPDWVGSRTSLRPEEIALLYRVLRKGREDNKDEPGAADFYYGEMEMRRLAHRTAWGERAILALYWLFSGYGLRGLRALVWLGVAVITLGLALHAVGFSEPLLQRSLWNSWLYAAESTLSIPSGQIELTEWGRVVRIMLRLTGPVLLALTLLAIRNRVKR